MALGSDHDEVADNLRRLLKLLKEQGYTFTTSTPASHARVLARRERMDARSLEDVLGWSLPFAPGVIPADIETCLENAGMLSVSPRGRISRIRVSSLEGNLYLHSAYPTDDEDAVFFGPDSYRFAAMIERELTCEPTRRGARIVDIGTGAGVGAITAALLCSSAHVVMTDINRAALRLAALNAEAAGVTIHAIETRGLDGIEETFDVAMINPPYIIDGQKRAYRDGGTMHGANLSVELARVALKQLRRSGRIFLYTGSAIIQGRDALHAALANLATDAGGDLRYKVVDPDVFGEELSSPQYHEVERIALVNACIRKPV